MDTSDTFLKYRKKDKTTFLVSIDDILNSGVPIDEEDGDDLELVGGALYRKNGKKIK